MIAFGNLRFQKIGSGGRSLPIWERPPPETRVGHEPEYQLYRDDEPPPPPPERRPCQPEGGQEDCRPAPDRNRGGRHLFPLIFRRLSYNNGCFNS